MVVGQTPPAFDNYSSFSGVSGQPCGNAAVPMLSPGYLCQLYHSSV